MDANDLIRLVNLVSAELSINCPVLSGNMKSNLEIVDIRANEITICISAPFYDLKEWKETGVIKFTGSPKKWPQFTDYAYWVNKSGAFSRHNKSQYWVNRSIYNSATTVANEIGAILVNRLPLA